jgi:chemotaxis protein histidine kinase CheA
MNTPLSLVQELRGIRGGQKHSHSDLEGLLSEIREARREWQEQVDQAQNLLHNLLGSVAELCGVELPGMAGGEGKGGDSSLRLGFKTLKDRIRNELEGYASTSAADVAKQIQGQSAVVLEPLEKELNARMDNLAEEFREKLKVRLAQEQDQVAEQARARTEEMLQGKMNDFAEWIRLMTEGSVSSIPAEVQKSLEPHVEQVKDRLKNAFQQQLSMVAMESERTLQTKVEAIKTEVQSLVGGLSDQARQACSMSTQQAMKDFENRLNLAVQQAAGQIEAKSRAHTEENLNTIKSHMDGLTSASKVEFQSYADAQVSGFREKLATAAKELQQKSAADIVSNLQKASQDALNTSLAQVKQHLDQTLEQSKGELKATMGTMTDDARKQMGEYAVSARDSLASDATRLSDNLKKLGEELKIAEKQRITDMVQSMTDLSRQTLEHHAVSVKQVADTQVEAIHRSLSEMQDRMAADYEAQLRQYVEAQRQSMMDDIQKQVEQASSSAVDEIRASTGQVVQDLSGKVNKEVNTATTLLNQWAHQTTTWAEASIKESLESYKRQVAEVTNSLLDNQRSTIEDRIGDLQGRLEQAASLLRVTGQTASELEKATRSKKS